MQPQMDKRAQPPAHSRIEEGSRVQGQGAQGQGCTPYSFGLPCRDALDLLPRASSCCRKYDQLKFAYNGIRDGWLVRKARALFLRCIVLRRRNICSSLLHFSTWGIVILPLSRILSLHVQSGVLAMARNSDAQKPQAQNIHTNLGIT